MRREPEYRKGDHLVISDRDGFTRYRSECRREWTGLLVGIDEWEPKHPQLEIRSVKDDQSIKDARPDKSVEVGTTTTSSSAIKEAQLVVLSSVANIRRLTNLGITLDNSEIQWTFATDDPSGSNVSINESLLDAVASGNTVYVGDNGEENYTTLSDSERRAQL